MNTSRPVISPNAPAIPNGSGAAAILSAGIGSFALAVLAFAGDKSASAKNLLVFYKPTGPLSGVTTAAILIWLFTWGILEWRWRNRTVAVGRTNAIALTLLGLSLLLTFPPVVDHF
jgi:hypothetical protein